eukprot:6702705-Alexandrium_andersonii.AAC.1
MCTCTHKYTGWRRGFAQRSARRWGTGSQEELPSGSRAGFANDSCEDMSTAFGVQRRVRAHSNARNCNRSRRDGSMVYVFEA